MKDFSKATPRPWEKITQSNEVIVLRKGHIELARFNPNIDEGEINAELAQIAVNNFDKMKEVIGNALANQEQYGYLTDQTQNEIKQLLESLK